jgi:hypothetical protein
MAKIADDPTIAAPMDCPTMSRKTANANPRYKNSSHTLTVHTKARNGRASVRDCGMSLPAISNSLPRRSAGKRATARKLTICDAAITSERPTPTAMARTACGTAKPRSEVAEEPTPARAWTRQTVKQAANPLKRDRRAVDGDPIRGTQNRSRQQLAHPDCASPRHDDRKHQKD